MSYTANYLHIEKIVPNHMNSPAGPLGSLFAYREESRIPSVQEPDARGSRPRPLPGR